MSERVTTGNVYPRSVLVVERQNTCVADHHNNFVLDEIAAVAAAVAVVANGEPEGQKRAHLVLVLGCEYAGFQSDVMHHHFYVQEKHRNEYECSP